MTAGGGGGPAGLWVHHRAPRTAAPDAERVVLVHGALDRSASLVRVGGRLGDVDVTRYDRRGYGRSAGLGPATGLDQHVDDLLVVVGDRPAVLVGHSIGGLVALAAAARRPGVADAVVAYEPPTPWATWWAPPPSAVDEGTGDAGDEAERFLRRMAGDDAWAALPPATRAARRAEGPALLVDLRSARELPFDPGAVTCPVVLGCGDGTGGSHRRAVDLLAALLPTAEVVVVPGAGHGAHLQQPTAMAALVRRGLDRAGRRHG